jgi:hypothetical protein
VKNKIAILITLLVLYLTTNNNTGDPLRSFELFALGIGIWEGETYFNLLNFLLNLGSVLIYLTVIINPLAARLEMTDYILTRGGETCLKKLLLKTALSSIGMLILLKQLVYLIFWLWHQGFETFYFYVMASTFLTLLMLALTFILLKFKGWKTKIALFMLCVFYLISQRLTLDFSLFGIVVIAGRDWNWTYLIIKTLICAGLYKNLKGMKL